MLCLGRPFKREKLNTPGNKDFGVGNLIEEKIISRELPDIPSVNLIDEKVIVDNTHLHSQNTATHQLYASLSEFYSIIKVRKASIENQDTYGYNADKKERVYKCIDHDKLFTGIRDKKFPIVRFLTTLLKPFSGKNKRNLGATLPCDGVDCPNSNTPNSCPSSNSIHKSLINSSVHQSNKSEHRISLENIENIGEVLYSNNLSNKYEAITSTSDNPQHNAYYYDQSTSFDPIVYGKTNNEPESQIYASLKDDEIHYSIANQCSDNKKLVVNNDVYEVTAKGEGTTSTTTNDIRSQHPLSDDAPSTSRHKPPDPDRSFKSPHQNHKVPPGLGRRSNRLASSTSTLPLLPPDPTHGRYNIGKTNDTTPASRPKAHRRQASHDYTAKYYMGIPPPPPPQPLLAATTGAGESGAGPRRHFASLRHIPQSNSIDSGLGFETLFREPLTGSLIVETDPGAGVQTGGSYADEETIATVGTASSFQKQQQLDKIKEESYTDVFVRLSLSRLVAQMASPPVDPVTNDGGEIHEYDYLQIGPSPNSPSSITTAGHTYDKLDYQRIPANPSLSCTDTQARISGDVATTSRNCWPASSLIQPESRYLPHGNYQSIYNDCHRVYSVPRRSSITPNPTQIDSGGQRQGPYQPSALRLGASVSHDNSSTLYDVPHDRGHTRNVRPIRGPRPKVRRPSSIHNGGGASDYFYYYRPHAPYNTDPNVLLENSLYNFYLNRMPCHQRTSSHYHRISDQGASGKSTKNDTENEPRYVSNYTAPRLGKGVKVHYRSYENIPSLLFQHHSYCGQVGGTHVKPPPRDHVYQEIYVGQRRS